MADRFKKVEVPQVSDLIIRQILTLLEQGDIKPGEQLPSEVSLQKSFGVAKQQLKAAFKKLELYGVLETRPQSGTYIADIEPKILVGLISNILDIRDIFEPLSLMDTRILLETRAAELAAARMSSRELDEVKLANDIFFNKSMKKSRAIEDDIFFHLEIVKFSRSSTIIALYSFITRQLIDIWRKMDIFDANKTEKRLEATFAEHTAIIENLERRDGAGSAEAMRKHLESVYKETELLSKVLQQD